LRYNIFATNSRTSNALSPGSPISRYNLAATNSRDSAIEDSNAIGESLVELRGQLNQRPGTGIDAESRKPARCLRPESDAPDFSISKFSMERD
jgi:hypothetical protein